MQAQKHTIHLLRYNHVQIFNHIDNHLHKLWKDENKKYKKY